jgi:hypothetical protein
VRFALMMEDRAKLGRFSKALSLIEDAILASRSLGERWRGEAPSERRGHLLAVVLVEMALRARDVAGATAGAAAGAAVRIAVRADIVFAHAVRAGVAAFVLDGVIGLVAVAGIVIVVGVHGVPRCWGCGWAKCPNIREKCTNKAL